MDPVREGLEALAGHCQYLVRDYDANDLRRLRNDLRIARLLAGQLETAIGSGASPSLTVVEQERVAPKVDRVDGPRFHAAIVGVFQDAIGPLTVKEIAASLITLGVPLPGQGRPANIISHLKRIPQIKRVGYGRYDLVQETVRRGRMHLAAHRTR